MVTALKKIDLYLGPKTYNHAQQHLPITVLGMFYQC